MVFWSSHINLRQFLFLFAFNLTTGFGISYPKLLFLLPVIFDLQYVDLVAFFFYLV